MVQAIVRVSLLVKDYDEAIDFYTKKLHFTMVEDDYIPELDKRWVVIAPPGSNGTAMVLTKAVRPEQDAFVGNQAGGQVMLFLGTDDFWRDYNDMKAAGVEFIKDPNETPYGTVAVFQDLYGNKWDLIQFPESHPMYSRVR